MIVDTHVHVWQPGDGHRVLIRERVARLDADFGFERLAPRLQSAGVGRVILVSAAQSFAETERLFGVADRFRDHVAGVIGFLDMDAADFESRLDMACAHSAFVGLRLPLLVFDDPDWIRRRRAGLALEALADRGLVAQVLAAPRHLVACAEVLAGHPDLKIVIDHAGNPGSQHRDDAVWRDGLAALGKHTAALCKVGDFSLPAGPLADEGRCDAILGHVVACFGKDRLVYGSNWPVSTLQQEYPGVLTGLRAAARRVGLDPDQFDRSMTRNALHIYSRAARAGG